MSTAEIIAIRNLKFAYTASKPVLDIPELRIAAGEKIFLHGPSGSGKTTLLGMLTGVLTPDAGEIKILQTDIVQLSDSRKDAFRGTHMGYIFQMFNLIPYLSVYENIVLPCLLNPIRRTRVVGAIEASVDHIVEALGIAALLHTPVTELSVGQQQRVAAARALLGKPEIVIADEPTSSLDFDHRERFLELLFSQCDENQTTLIFVSHDRTLAHLFGRTLSLSELNSVKA